MQFSSELSLFSPYLQSPLVFDIRKLRLRATAKKFVPKALALPSTVTHAPSPTLNEQAPMSRSRVEPAATISVNDLEAPATPEEIDAAIVIQVAYRRAIQRREAITPKDEIVKMWYRQCVDAQVHLRGSRTYLQHFLGPLVDVLIWADAVVRLLKNRRDRVRKEINHAQIEKLMKHHKQIEGLMEHLAVCK